MPSRQAVASPVHSQFQLLRFNIPIRSHFLSSFQETELKVKFVLREGERLLLTCGSEEGAVYEEFWESERIP